MALIPFNYPTSLTASNFPSSVPVEGINTNGYEHIDPSPLTDEQIQTIFGKIQARQDFLKAENQTLRNRIAILENLNKELQEKLLAKSKSVAEKVQTSQPMVPPKKRKCIQEGQTSTSSQKEKTNGMPESEEPKSTHSLSQTHESLPQEEALSVSITQKKAKPSPIHYENSKYRGEYEGDLLDGVPHGRGILKIEDGDIYEGEFNLGNFEGEGIYIYANGDIFKGEFRGGYANGNLTCRFSDGNVYVGRVKRNKISGRGVWTMPSGDKYEGLFQESLLSGEGKLTYANGNIHEGMFVKDLPNGKGVLKKPGETYSGNFVNGVLEGHGILVTDRATYRGQFRSENLEGIVQKKTPFNTKETYFHQGKEMTKQEYMILTEK